MKTLDDEIRHILDYDSEETVALTFECKARLVKNIVSTVENQFSQPSDVSDEIKRLKDRGDMLKEQFRLASLKIVELSKQLAELEVLHYGEVQFPVKSGQIKPTIEVEKESKDEAYNSSFCKCEHPIFLQGVCEKCGGFQD